MTVPLASFCRDMPVRPTHYLQPGALVIASDGALLQTILGSCVAVCLWDRARNRGGMNHFMLPNWASGTASPRFGNIAMRKLIDDMLGLGSRKSDMVASVYGGASVVAALAQSHALGMKNADLALDFLRDENISIGHCDVGGNRGRKIEFETYSGQITMRMI